MKPGYGLQEYLIKEVALIKPGHGLVFNIRHLNPRPSTCQERLHKLIVARIALALTMKSVSGPSDRSRWLDIYNTNPWSGVRIQPKHTIPKD
jgi:hypothetical protein